MCRASQHFLRLLFQPLVFAAFPRRVCVLNASHRLMLHTVHCLPCTAHRTGCWLCLHAICTIARHRLLLCIGLWILVRHTMHLVDATDWLLLHSIEISIAMDIVVPILVTVYLHFMLRICMALLLHRRRLLSIAMSN